MITLKPWRQVVTPHADIRQGKFDASVFAVDLGEVLAGRGTVDYRDAQTFFSKTYLTHGLTQLLIDVMRRLSGAGRSESVIQLQWESAKTCVGEHASFQWCMTPHLTLNKDNNRGHNTGVDMHIHRGGGMHRHTARERSSHTDRAQHNIH